jgi:hypothetical protein
LFSLSVALHVAITLNFKLKEEISNHFVSHVGKLDGKWFMNGYWVEKPSHEHEK